MKRIAMPIEQAIDRVLVALFSAGQQFDGFILVGPHVTGDRGQETGDRRQETRDRGQGTGEC